MNLNLKATEQNTYDAIVIGTGISGGWAAKELCEKGLKTLVLERGRMVKHIEDYPTMNLKPWEIKYGDRLTPREKKEDYPVQSQTAYAVLQTTKHFFVKDSEHPYNQIKPFTWTRGYHVGGRSLTWARWSFRLSDIDLESNAKDGVGVDWPIRYKDLEPWYDYVETYIGVSGRKDGLKQLPDGKFLPPWEMNCIEKHLEQKIAENYTDRMLTLGRSSNITQSVGGRSKCMARNLCRRGCPYGAFFSSNAVTLPAAEATGNMTLRPHSIVHTIIYDKEKKKAVGVRIIDAQTKETIEFYAKVIFSCASTLGSTSILLNSTSDVFPNGLGNGSGELGHNLMDHHFRIGAFGTHDGYTDQYYKGRRPTGVIVPKYQNLDNKTARKDYLRGFSNYGGGGREGYWKAGEEGPFSFGEEYKRSLMTPGPWTFRFNAFGECLPHHDNKVYLDYQKTDNWGMPTLSVDMEFRENELAMRPEMMSSSAEMLEVAGFKNIETYDDQTPPGLGIHEMGTARMGKDPKTSVLNRWNQMHEVPNVFVTDGSCMASSSWQNPSLTYMALTARAVDYAIDQMKKQNI